MFAGWLLWQQLSWPSMSVRWQTTS
jgi:hypothetical protein